MVETTDLSITFNSSTKIKYPDISLSKGDASVILGNSGSGKTTLLHLLGGLRKPQTGSVTIGDKNLSSLSNTQLDKFRGERIGFIFQKPHLIKTLNVEENLLLAQHLAGKPQDRKRVSAVLEHLNMSHKKKSKISQLSEGQAQRIVIARAVVNMPTMILADEPTASLDDHNCEKVVDILKEQARENQSTLVIATHDNRVKSLFQNQVLLEDH